MLVFSMISAGTTGTETPPGITALSRRPPRTPPHSSSRSANGTPSGSSMLRGRVTCPDTEKISVPPEFGGPRLRTTAGPLRRMVGTEAKLRVLLMVVGAPYSPKFGRERRLEARLAGLALERVEQRGLLAADVGAGADESMELEVDAAAADVPAEQPRGIGFGERRFEARHRLAEELAADVVVGRRWSWWRSHRSPVPR